MKTIVLHCSDSAFGNAALITKWHLQRGFDIIGYHYILLNGMIGAGIRHDRFKGHIETGRSLNMDSIIDAKEIEAHVAGHNQNTIGICLIGHSGNFISEQIESCKNLIQMLREQFGRDTEVKQHSDYDPNKSYCAGFDKDMMARFNRI